MSGQPITEVQQTDIDEFSVIGTPGTRGVKCRIGTAILTLSPSVITDVTVENVKRVFVAGYLPWTNPPIVP